MGRLTQLTPPLDDQPRVTVIMPACNCEALIARAIDSVLGQTRRPLELIVVDDGSTDQTADIVQGYFDPAIKLLRQANAGPAAARNRGIELAQGNLVAFLDADDYWEPTFIERSVTFLVTHPEAVAVHCGQLIDPQGIRRYRPWFVRDGTGPIRQPCLLNNFFSFWAEHQHLCTGSAIIRRWVLREIGGLRPEFRLLEDWELWALVATHGPWGFIPEPLLVCDGMLASMRQGWMKKHRRRWAACQTVEQWQERIISCLREADRPGFEQIRARVARIIAFTCVLAGQDGQARRVVEQYGPAFEPNLISRFLLWGHRSGPLGWKVCVMLLKGREWLKSTFLALKYRCMH